MEKNILETFLALDNISELANNNPNFKVEHNCLNAVNYNIHKSLTSLIYKIGGLEKNNLALKFQLGSAIAPMKI